MQPFTVFGMWKNFNFQLVQETHFSQVLLFLKETFYKDEPIKGIMGNMTKDRVTDLDNRILPRLKDGKTFMAVDQESGKVSFACNGKLRTLLKNLVTSHKHCTGINLVITLYQTGVAFCE